MQEVIAKFLSDSNLPSTYSSYLEACVDCPETESRRNIIEEYLRLLDKGKKVVPRNAYRELTSLKMLKFEKAQNYYETLKYEIINNTDTIDFQRDSFEKFEREQKEIRQSSFDEIDAKPNDLRLSVTADLLDLITKEETKVLDLGKKLTEIKKRSDEKVKTFKLLLKNLDNISTDKYRTALINLKLQGVMAVLHYLELDSEARGVQICHPLLCRESNESADSETERSKSEQNLQRVLSQAKQICIYSRQLLSPSLSHLALPFVLLN